MHQGPKSSACHSLSGEPNLRGFSPACFQLNSQSSKRAQDQSLKPAGWMNTGQLACRSCKPLGVASSVLTPLILYVGSQGHMGRLPGRF